MKFHCQITAQRKHRPLYFTSDEQFQWMIAILQHFVPDISLELDGLKALGAQLGVVGPAHPPPPQTPMRSLPPSLERAYGQTTESSSNQSEYMSGRSESPTSEVGREDELQISEDLASSPNAEALHLSSTTITRKCSYSIFSYIRRESTYSSVPNDLTGRLLLFTYAWHSS